MIDDSLDGPGVSNALGSSGARGAHGGGPSHGAEAPTLSTPRSVFCLSVRLRAWVLPVERTPPRTPSSYQNYFFENFRANSSLLVVGTPFDPKS